MKLELLIQGYRLWPLRGLLIANNERRNLK